MHKKNPVLVICSINLKTWLNSIRTWLLIFFLMILCYMEVSGVALNMHQDGMVMNMAEIPFYFWNYGCNILMSSILLLVSATELPRQMPYQNLLLIRSSRKAWLVGQLLYVLGLVFTVIFYMTACMLIFSCGRASWHGGWSDTARIATGLFTENNAIVSEFVRSRFSPCQAVFVALLPPALFWISLLLVILLFGMWRRSEIGVLIDAVIILSSIIFSLNIWPNIPLPMQYTTLRSLHPEYNGMQTYWRTILFLGMLDFLIVILLFVRVRKMDLAFEIRNKE